ncbi:MAG: thiolase family protein [Candidatus Limnocylindrales bacterium]
MLDVVIVAGARTPIGSFGRSLAEVPASELGAIAARATIARSGIEPQAFDDVVVGCVGQFGDGVYLARQVGLGAGLPVDVPGVTVNRLCGSGLQAILSAAQAIRGGDARIILAGGAESMSRYPHLDQDTRRGRRMGDVTLADGLLRVLHDPFTSCHMGVTAENVAGRWEVSREDQDLFALESQRRAVEAVDQGRFRNEIVPVVIQDGRGGERSVDTDEHPRRDTSLDALAKLSPAFQDGGSVTAGNTAGINDGAAAVVVAAADDAPAPASPALRLVAGAVVGVPPDVMGIGPVPAVRRALDLAGLSLGEIDLIELNEAFAAQAVACIRELDADPARVNVNGGAIALGHPVGATGAILTVKLMNELARRQGRFGLVTACIGGGQGIAAIFERVEPANHRDDG